MVRILIKGTRVAALRALDDRSIDAYKIKELHTDFDTVLTQCDVPDRHLEVIHHWFHEPLTPPYPAGALMLFSLGQAWE